VKSGCGCGALTVDGDGDALGEDEAVSALKGRDLAELVELEVVGGHTLRRLRVDKLNVEAVLLCDREKRRGARVALFDSCQKATLSLQTL
jgi:hypothetical protein